MADFSLNGMAAILKARLGGERYSRQIASALALAYRGHDRQFREQADSRAEPVPYIVHPVGVAVLAAECSGESELVDGLDDLISACLTHDLLEDTEVSPYELEKATSKRTLELVTALSRPPSSEHLSREERNRSFLEAIKHAGRTAMFIKICDSLHNLSRPEQTPRRLLRKTFRKAREEYIELIEIGKLGDKLARRYRAAVNEVELLLSRTRGDDANRAGADDLESVFRYCRERTTRKVLELHDVVDVLREITGASDVIHTTVAEFLSSLEGGEISQHDEVPVAVGGAVAVGDLDVEGMAVPFEALPETIAARLASATRILSVSWKAFGVTQLFLLSLGPNAPRWVSEASLTVLVAFLLQRAVLHDAGKVAEMADVLRSHSVDLDPHLAIEAKLTAGSVAKLVHLQRAAAAVKGVLDSGLLDRLPEGVGGLVERLEARIKTVDSIVRKGMRKKSDGDHIEDLVGYRLVVGNIEAKSKVSEGLMERIQDTKLPFATSPVLKTVRTPKGYSATHIGFTVSMMDQGISVEIQVRTILEDAWARVSQAIDYKRTNIVARRNERVLKKLRDAIDELEGDL